MSIIVTEHAIDRFAERVIGIQSKSLTNHERGAIRGVICKAVGGADLSRRYIRTPLATYAMSDDGKVVTVLLPNLYRPASAKLGAFLGDRA